MLLKQNWFEYTIALLRDYSLGLAKCDQPALQQGARDLIRIPFSFRKCMNHQLYSLS